ncbi:MAG: hypothetical protein PVG79_00245 [Gemmatimonadales bacterium]
MRITTHHWLTRFAAIALALSLAAACQDESTGPTLEEVDPEGMAASIGDIVGSLTGNAELQSYNQMSEFIGLALGGGAAPTFDFAEGQGLQQGLGTFSRRLAACSIQEPTAALAGPIIDSEWAGTVFVWGGDGYVPGDEPNPFDEGVDAVRFILYAIDPIEGPIVELPVGHVDFIDESVEGQGNTLRVVVTPIGRDPIVNYAVTCELVGFAVEVAGTGFISDGVTQINLDLYLAVTQSGAVSMDFTLDVPSANLEIRFSAEADSFDAFDEGGTFDAMFSISRNNAVRFDVSAVDDVLDGVVRFCDAGNACSTVAVISGTLDDPIITDAQGDQLGQGAILAIGTLFEAAGAFVENLLPMLAPAFEICIPVG